MKKKLLWGVDGKIISVSMSDKTHRLSLSVADLCYFDAGYCRLRVLNTTS